MNNNMDPQEIMSRRNLLRNLGVVAGGAGVLAACGSPSAEKASAGSSATPLKVNLSDPTESLLHFTRIFGDTNSENFSTGWFEGTVYSVVGDSSKIIPLLGLEGIGTMRCQAIEGGGFRVFNRELAFYKDLRTGEYLDEWKNPLNNKLVETFPMHNMTVNAETAPILKMDIDGTELSIPFPARWRTISDYVFSTFEIHASVPSELQPDEWPVESPGPMTRISEMFQRTVRAEDLANADLTSVPYSGTWTRLSSWYPWMLMGQAEGHMFFRANMAKLGSPDDIPPAFMEKAMQQHAAYLEPPGLDSWGQPNDSTFNTYVRERSPQPAE